MESPETKITRIRIYSRVRHIGEIKDKRWINGIGPYAEFEEYSLGWYMYMENSYEGLYCGQTKPAFEPGDKVLISIRKVNG